MISKINGCHISLFWINSFLIRKPIHYTYNVSWQCRSLICVCLYIYRYVCVPVYTYIYLCIHTNTHIYMCVCYICVCVYIYIYITRHIYITMDVSMCACAYVIIYICIYIYVCVCVMIVTITLKYCMYGFKYMICCSFIPLFCVFLFKVNQVVIIINPLPTNQKEYSIDLQNQH